MSTYAPQIASAFALINAKGADLPLRRTTTTLDPVSQAATETVQTATFRAVGLPAGKSAEFVLGSLQRRNVIQLYVALKDQALIPQPGDVVTWGGNDWPLIWCTTYDPAADGAILTIAYAER